MSVIHIVAFSFKEDIPASKQASIREDFLGLKSNCRKEGKPYIEKISAGSQISIEAFTKNLQVYVYAIAIGQHAHLQYHFNRSYSCSHSVAWRIVIIMWKRMRCIWLLQRSLGKSFRTFGWAISSTKHRQRRRSDDQAQDDSDAIKGEVVDHEETAWLGVGHT